MALKLYETDKKETSYIDSWLIYTLWNEFSSDFDVQRDFGKNIVAKNLGRWNYSLLLSTYGLFISTAGFFCLYPLSIYLFK